MATKCLKEFASFPNTRERPRKPTKTANTEQVSISQVVGLIDKPSNTVVLADVGGETINGNTIIAAPNGDRTYLTLRNLDPSESMAYSYDDDVDLHLVTAGGNKGMVLKAGDSVDTEQIEKAIYGKPLTAVTIIVATDEGQG